MLHIAFRQLLLIQHLERANERFGCFLVTRQVDTAKLAAAELLAEIEIVE